MSFPHNGVLKSVQGHVLLCADAIDRPVSARRARDNEVLDSSDYLSPLTVCTGAAGVFCTQDPESVTLIKHFSPTDEVSAALRASVMSAAESVSQFVLRRLTMNELQDVSNSGLQELLPQPPSNSCCLPLSHSLDQPEKGCFFGVMASLEATLGSTATTDFHTAQCKRSEAAAAAAAMSGRLILACSLTDLDLSWQKRRLTGRGCNEERVTQLLHPVVNQKQLDSSLRPAPSNSLPPVRWQPPRSHSLSNSTTAFGQIFRSLQGVLNSNHCA